MVDTLIEDIRGLQIEIAQKEAELKKSIDATEQRGRTASGIVYEQWRAYQDVRKRLDNLMLSHSIATGERNFEDDK